MENVIKWLKDNLGDNVQIMIPQFERTEKLEFEYVPATEEQFRAVIEKAPWDILKGMGFRKWDTMNNIIAENNEKPAKHTIQIPIINPEDIDLDAKQPDDAKIKIEGSNLCVEVGKETGCPSELLEVDEDILMIPGEWYNSIPNGFMVTGLWGESYPFEKGKSDDDIRFGCLPYGIRRAVAKNNV